MSNKLNESQKMACNLLATGMKTSEILIKLKIRPETLSRWKKKELFSECLEKAQKNIINDIHDLQKYIFFKSQDVILSTLMNENIDILKKAMIATRYLNLAKGKESIEDKLNERAKDNKFEDKFGLNF